MDNTSANQSMCNALGKILANKYNIQYSSMNGQIRCQAHAVNCVVQKILASLDLCEDPENSNYYLINAKSLDLYDATFNKLLWEHESEELSMDTATEDDCATLKKDIDNSGAAATHSPVGKVPLIPPTFLLTQLLISTSLSYV